MRKGVCLQALAKAAAEGKDGGDGEKASSSFAAKRMKENKDKEVTKMFGEALEAYDEACKVNP